MWDGEGMKSDESRMKIQMLQLGLSLFGQNEGDLVAPLSKLVGEMEVRSQMAKSKPWVQCYMQFCAPGHGHGHFPSPRLVYGCNL